MLFKPSSTAIDPYLQPPDVHEVNRERGVGIVVALVFALLLTLAHALNVYFFFAGATAPAVGMVFHIVLVVTTAIIARAMILQGFDSRFLMVLLITSTGLSVFGAAGTVVSILLYLWYSRRALPFMEWFNSMFPHHTHTLSEQIYEDIVVGRDESAKNYSVMPFLEVMQLGSTRQKLEALSKMTMLFHPNFAPAFRRALVDDSNMIRVQAATAIARIEHQFAGRVMKLTRLLQENPEDTPLLLALAEHYDAYAFTGILDPERERQNRERALEYYQDYLLLKPENEQARLSVGRIYLRSGEAEKAAGWLADCVQRGYRSNNTLIWFAEALFEAGRYAELRAIASQFPQLAESLRSSHPQLVEAIMLWGRASAAPPAPPLNLRKAA